MKKLFVFYFSEPKKYPVPVLDYAPTYCDVLVATVFGSYW